MPDHPAPHANAIALHSPWRRHLRFTREGKLFVGITFGVGFAAINTGNNLLYLLLGMQLALIIVSGVLSEWALQDLTIVRKLPQRAYADSAYLVEIEVSNRKPRMPSYAIEIEDLRGDEPSDKRCFFLKVAANGSQLAAYQRIPKRRGTEVHTAFRIATRFPFGLFEKSKSIPVRNELLVYPAIRPVPLRRGATDVRAGDRLVFARGRGLADVGLRAMREHDDARDIHWPKTAATGQLIVRERGTDGAPAITLRLITKRLAGDSNPGVKALDPGFERDVRELASLAVAHLQRDHSVTLIADSGDVVRGSTFAHRDRFLRFLALVEPAPRAETHPPIDGESSLRGRHETRTETPMDTAPGAAPRVPSTTAATPLLLQRDPTHDEERPR